MSNGSADCPVEGCGFSDIPSLVAAHVNGTADEGHDWDSLPFEGPGAFLSAARSEGPTMPATSESDLGADTAEGGDNDETSDVSSSASDGSESKTDVSASGSKTDVSASESKSDVSASTAESDGTESAQSGSTTRGSRAIAGNPEPAPVRCPVDGCDYTGPPKSVAAHVSGKRDPAHDMDRIEYPNAKSFPKVAQTEDWTATPETAVESNAGGTETATATATETETDPDYTFDESAVRQAAEVALETAEGVDALDDLPLSKLVDLHVAFSVLSGEASSVRRDLKSAIVDRVAEDGVLEGTLGTVERSTGTHRSLRDAEVVRRELYRAGIDPNETRTFDADLVADVIEGADVEESAVFETGESDRLRRADVDEEQFSPEG